MLKVTYVYHSCFLIRKNNVMFIFDVPSNELLSDEHIEFILDSIREKDVYIFISHGHRDHFNMKILNFISSAKNVSYIISEDVIVKHGLYIFSGIDKYLVVAKPNQTYNLNDYEVVTFESTDLGVAYLIKINDDYVYYSGDLALWVWDHFPKLFREAIEERFFRELSKICKYNIKLAFIAIDPRVKNWAGALDFIEAIKPEYVVPMHLLGHVGLIEGFQKDVKRISKDVRVMKYERTGDSLVVS